MECRKNRPGHKNTPHPFSLPDQEDPDGDVFGVLRSSLFPPTLMRRQMTCVYSNIQATMFMFRQQISISICNL